MDHEGGKLMPRGRRKKPLEERFWSKVDMRGPEDCWEWTAALNEAGYGMIGVGGRGEGVIRAHRLSLILAGRDPGDAFVLHSCDNRKCVNPAHLRAGTAAENVADMISRDRACEGERAPWAKLSARQIGEIRTARARGETCASLAKRYGVCNQMISLISRGERWKRAKA